MAKSNFERMIELADEIFAVRNDPDQLDVNEEVRERLLKIHPATMSDYDDGKGPVVWILLIPTTMEIMHKFLKGEITEKQLLFQTPLNIPYDALYLCSALALPEYRKKGIAKKVTLDAIAKIRKDHELKAVFVWPFSKEGDVLSDLLAKELGLPLYKKITPR